VAASNLYVLADIRERVRLDARRLRRPFEVKAEERRLGDRRKRNIFELMTEEEVARLREVAPGLMQMRDKR
jgi:hypothetical protein